MPHSPVSQREIPTEVYVSHAAVEERLDRLLLIAARCQAMMLFLCGMTLLGLAVWKWKP